MKRKIWIAILVLLVAGGIYYALSIAMSGGDFVVTHYYSYGSIEECKEKGTLVSDNLKITIEGDSLNQIEGLGKKFFTCKSMYQTFYGFLIHTKNEDKEYRRIMWREPVELEIARKKNWGVKYKGKLTGMAFSYGWCDAKIGDTVELVVENLKPKYKVGTIKIVVE